jgi:hypothetical protein
MGTSTISMAIFNSYVSHNQIILKPWPSYHWPPNWSVLSSLLCMCLCAFFVQENSVIGKHGFPSQIRGFPWVSSNIFQPILTMLLESYKTPLAFEVSSASTRQSMPWTSRIPGPCSLVTQFSPVRPVPSWRIFVHHGTHAGPTWGWRLEHQCYHHKFGW